MILKILDKLSFNLEEFLFKIGPVRFINSILFPILFMLSLLEQKQEFEECIIHILIFCLFINDFILGSWSKYRSNYLKITNHFELESLKLIDFTNLRQIIYLGKKIPFNYQLTVFMRKNIFNNNNRKESSSRPNLIINDVLRIVHQETKHMLTINDPQWVSPQMKKIKKDNVNFVLTLVLLLFVSFAIDFTPQYIQDWFFFLFSASWSFVLVYEVYLRARTFNISKKFATVCYQLAFVVFLIGFIFIQK